MPTPACANAASRPRPRSPADWLWLAFLTWTAIGFVVLPLDIGEGQARLWIANPALLRLTVGFLRQSDAIWILLAASCAYVHAAAAEGLPTARRWAAIILAASAGFEWIGVRTGVPFGTYRYTDQFGWRVGGVLPAAIPLAWLVILVCGRYLVLSFRPQANRWELALGVAFVALLTDLNLEFVAWKVRGYWIWYPDQAGAAPFCPPWQNYLSWFVLSFCLSLLLPPNFELRKRPRPTRPILILGLMNLLFASSMLVSWARRPAP